MRGAPRPVRWLLIACVQLAIGLAAVEALLALLLRAPALTAHAPERLIHIARHLYNEQDRHYLQYDPRMARFDPALFYTLRPGRFVHEDREFRNTYFVDSAGLRDDEASLDAPRVVVAGDSITMGWGADQEDTYPQRLERALGKRVLNAGVASYGTVRQLLILERARIDPSRLAALVIQYHGNDYPENASYLHAGGRLHTSSQALFESIAAHQEERRRYRPFEYLETFVRGKLGAPHPGPPLPALGVLARSRSPANEARTFLFALEHALPDALRSARVIVIHIDTRGAPPPETFAELDRLRRELPEGSLARRMELVDLNARLAPGDFYVIDDHMRASGHAAVAQALLEVLAQPGGAGSLRRLAPLQPSSGGTPAK